MRTARVKTVVFALVLGVSALARADDDPRPKTFQLTWPQHVPGEGPLRLTTSATPHVKVSFASGTFDEAEGVKHTELRVEHLVEHMEDDTFVIVRAERRGGSVAWRCAVSSGWNVCGMTIVDASDPRPADHDAMTSWCGPDQRLAALKKAPTVAARLRLTSDLVRALTQSLHEACRGRRCVAPVEELVDELDHDPVVDVAKATSPSDDPRYLAFDASLGARRLDVHCQGLQCVASVAIGSGGLASVVAGAGGLAVAYVSDEDERGRGCSSRSPRRLLEADESLMSRSRARAGAIPGPLVARRGIEVHALRTTVDTPWPASITIAAPELDAMFDVEGSDARLVWRADDGPRLGFSARAASDSGGVHTMVRLPTRPQRLQHIDVTDGHPTSFTIEVRGDHRFLWTCSLDSPSCELRRVDESYDGAPRQPFTQRFCVSPFDKTPNVLVGLSDAAPAQLSKELPMLRTIASTLLDEAASYLEHQCKGHACDDSAEAALQVVQHAVGDAGAAELAQVESGPAFELRRDGRLVATVRCASYNCSTHVPLADGTRYGFAAGLNATSHPHCIEEAGFRGPAGEELGTSGGENDRGATGRFIRLWRKP